MAPKKGEEDRPVEIESTEQWEAIVASPDLNVVDVYAEWCGPCMCLATLYKRLLMDHEDVLVNAKAAEGKTIKYWSLCAEKVDIEAFEQYKGDPCPHLAIWLKGEQKEMITGADAPKLTKIIGEMMEDFVLEA